MGFICHETSRLQSGGDRLALLKILSADEI